MTSISFIVTFYNKEKYVPIVLDTIVSQRGLDDVEYIFVDDGSTDDTLKALREQTQRLSNVKIVTQVNAGPAAAVNAGLNVATKDFIKLWDGDDIAHPDTTATLLQAAIEQQADVVFCDIDFTDVSAADYFSQKDEFYNTVSIKPAAHVLLDPVRFFVKGPYANPTAMLFRTSALRQSGGTDPKIFIQDYALPVRVIHFARFVHIPQTLTFAFRDVDQRLSRNEAQTLHDLNAVLYSYYLESGQYLNRKQKIYLGQRVAGRAWKWSRRHNGKGIFSSEHLRFLKSRLSPFPLSHDDLYKTLLPFRVGHTIRTKL